MLEMMFVVLAQAEPARGGLFGREEVSFWGTRKKPPPISWAEPIVGPDGRVQVFVPPPEVREFLEAPTRENGEKYLAWQRLRLERLRKAAQILAEIRSEVREPTLLYFSRPDCPYCAAQDRVLAAMKIAVRKVEANSPLWTTYGIRATPTLVWVRPGRAARKLEGFTPREVLEKEVRRVDR